MMFATHEHPRDEDSAWAVERHGFFGWLNVAGGPVLHTLEQAVKLVGDYAAMEQDMSMPTGISVLNGTSIQRPRWPIHALRIRNTVTEEILPGDFITK